MNQPTDDTPSVTPFGRASSLREGAGMRAVPFIVPPGNRKIAGDFHRPYEGSGNFTFYHSLGDTPSVSLSLDSSLREGAGSGCEGAFHSTGYLRNRGGAGDFHRPYEGSDFFTFHRSSEYLLKSGR